LGKPKKDLDPSFYALIFSVGIDKRTCREIRKLEQEQERRRRKRETMDTYPTYPEKRRS
jgi:hypothetical protein